MDTFSRAWYNSSYTLAAKPIKSLELHYTTIHHFHQNLTDGTYSKNTCPLLFDSVSGMGVARSSNEVGSTSSSHTRLTLGLASIASKIRLIPEGGWGWVICVSAFFTQLIVMGINNSFGILFTTLLEEFKKSKAETGNIQLI